jgi:hypothetical protein
MMKDAFKAVGIASMLSVSGFAFGLSGAFWALDVSGIKQFSRELKRLLGGDKKQQELERLPVSEEVATVEKSLNELLK